MENQLNTVPQKRHNTALAIYIASITVFMLTYSLVAASLYL